MYVYIQNAKGWEHTAVSVYIPSKFHLKCACWDAHVGHLSRPFVFSLVWHAFTLSATSKAVAIRVPPSSNTFDGDKRQTSIELSSLNYLYSPATAWRSISCFWKKYDLNVTGKQVFHSAVHFYTLFRKKTSLWCLILKPLATFCLRVWNSTLAKTELYNSFTQKRSFIEQKPGFIKKVESAVKIQELVSIKDWEYNIRENGFLSAPLIPLARKVTTWITSGNHPLHGFPWILSQRTS